MKLTINKLHLTFDLKKKLSIVRSGQILIIAIVFLAVILILASSLFGRVAQFLQFGSRSISKEQAVNLAEAGIEEAIWQLNATAGACNFCNQERALGANGTFLYSVTDKSANLKTITSTGFVPNTTNPKSKQTIKTDVLISAETVAFRYAVQAGTGGVVMENEATINGTIYSNGYITGSGTTTINGDAYAVFSISSPNPFVTGSKHPGADPSEMPTIDYQYWKDQATAGGTTDCPGGTCNFVGGTHNIGPQKYVGNLIIQNGAFVTINGPVYVTGFIDIKNDPTTLKLNDSFGSNGTVLITDGNITVQNGGKIEPTNANPKGYILSVTTSIDPQEAVQIKNEGINSVFYALEGGATLQNDAKVTALVAKQLLIKNSASLTYDQGLASAQFSQGPGGSWVIKKGTYRFTSSP